MTLSEAETARRRAVTGLRNLGDEQAAEDFERMTPQQYAQRKGVELITQNPRRLFVPRKDQGEIIVDLKERLSDLEDEVEQLQEENESLQDRLDAAAEAITAEAAGDEEDDGEGDDLDNDEEE